MVHEPREEFHPDIGEDAEGRPGHAVGIQVGEEAANEHDRGDGGTDPNNVGDGDGAGGVAIEQGIVAIGEDAIRRVADDEEEKSIGEAVEHPEEDAEGEATFVGDEVFEEFAVGAFSGLDELAGGHVGHVFSGNFFHAWESEAIPRMTVSVDSSRMGAPLAFGRSDSGVSGAVCPA